MTDLAIRAGVCTGDGPCDSSIVGTGANWVTKAGGQDPYLHAIIHALMRSGHSESEAEAIAVATVKHWASGGGNVSAATRARAAKSVAAWEALKAKAHATRQFVGETTSSAADLLPVGPSPKVAANVEARLAADKPHAYRGAGLMACTVCGKPASDPIHQKKRKRDETGGRATPTRGLRSASSRQAHKQTFVDAADRIEPKLHAAMVGLFDRQRKATLSRLSGSRGRRMLRSAIPPSSPDRDPQPPAIPAPPPDPSAIFDQAFWTAETIQVLESIYGQAAAASLARLSGQLGVPTGTIATVRPIGTAASDLVEAGTPGTKGHDPASILRSRANRMAATITDTTWNQIREELAQGVEQGESIPQLADRIRHVFDMAQTRAETIARTEVVSAMNEAAHTYASNLPAGTIGKKEWLAKDDDRTRPTHRLADGQTVPLHAPFHVGTSLMLYPGDPAAPPDEVVNCRCFPAGTLVMATGIRAIFRREYEGDLVEITTASGHHLSGTPNHPVLTSAGWVPLSRLSEGDDLVGGRIAQQVSGSDPDIDHMPTPISELFDAFAFSASVGLTRHRIGGTPMDFHGDGGQSQIEVVLADLQLARGNDPAIGEDRRELLFASAHAQMSLSGHSSPFVVGPHANELSFSTAPWSDSGRYQSEPDRLSTDVVSTGERLLGLAAGISLDYLGVRQTSSGTTCCSEGPHGLTPAAKDPEANQFGSEPFETDMARSGRYNEAGTVAIHLDRVLQVTRNPFAGHVYNLSTRTGRYIANGIVTHNCNLLYHPAPLGGAA